MKRNIIGIITTCNLKYAPYVKLYTDILDECGYKYEIITWNKKNLMEDVAYAYNGKKDDGAFIKSFFQYIGFGRFINRILDENNYSKLIVCNPAPLIFIKKRYLRKYTGNFIWDIRDDTPIRKVFKYRFDSICKLPSYIVTSSQRYESWIGRKTILSHNANKNMINTYFEYTPEPKKRNKLVLINAGKMIEQKENIRVLERLGNNMNYEFAYYGSDVPGKLEIKDYCQKNKIYNVKFYGTYNKEEIIDIYRENGDLVNILRADTVVNSDALPNKLYEAVIAGIPIAVYRHNTVVADYVQRYNLGIVLQDTSEVDKIIQYTEQFDYDKYAKGRKDFLNLVLNDIDTFESVVRSFVKG